MKQANERLRQWFDAYRSNGYINGSVLVACKDEILINEGFGMANWEHRVQNSPKTKFRIGSITKTFTSACIFLLQQQQKLNVDDTINKYLPGYSNSDRITIHHILTHTSGIPNYTSFPDFWSRTMRLSSTLQQLIQSFQDKELDFEPGEKFGYSNSGYALLTWIIEHVSGMPYLAFVREKICLPLGIDHTGCDNGAEIVPDLASGYSFWEKPVHAAFTDLSFPLGAYGMYSTTEDLFSWDAALKSSNFIRNELKERMFSPRHGSYACGWDVSSVLGRACTSHFGEISGFFCDFLRFADEEVTIIMLCNSMVVPVTHLSRQIAKVIFGEPVQIPIPAVPITYKLYPFLEGEYRLEKDPKHILKLTVQENVLYLTVPKRYCIPYKFKLVPVQNDAVSTTFVTEAIHEKLVVRSDTAQLQSMEYTDCYGNTSGLLKIK